MQNARKNKPAKALRKGNADDAELAAKLANDVAEGIDCGESRHDLRRAIAWWSLEGFRNAMDASGARTEIALLRYCIELLASKREGDRKLGLMIWEARAAH